MARVFFPYVQVDQPASEPYPNGRTALRPFVVATITARNGKSVKFLVWPDSGADVCMFPFSVARLLQIDILNCPKDACVGVGGISVTHYDTVTIDLGQGVRFEAYAGFTQGLEAQGFGLLGQDAFFSSYDVCFKQRSMVFTVEIP